MSDAYGDVLHGDYPGWTTRPGVERRADRWCTVGMPVGSTLAGRRFCICLMAMDLLSVDDRRCSPAT